MFQKAFHHTYYTLIHTFYHTHTSTHANPIHITRPCLSLSLASLFLLSYHCCCLFSLFLLYVWFLKKIAGEQGKQARNLTVYFLFFLPKTFIMSSFNHEHIKTVFYFMLVVDYVLDHGYVVIKRVMANVSLNYQMTSRLVYIGKMPYTL